MKKAFDSVSIMALKKAFERLRFPTKLADFIVHLYEKRRFSIITKYSNTEFFEAGNDIDQEEVISLLLWRIYFNLLLCKLHKCKYGARARVE